MASHDVINGVRRKLNEVLNKHEGKVTVGWRPSEETHKEGDVWEALDGRKWTIKNGIKQTVTKLDSAKTPIFCPSCSKPMNSRHDTKFWMGKGKCFDCVIKDETELRRTGKWQQVHDEQRRLSQIDMLKDKINELTDIRDNLSQLEIINADDTNILMVEKWSVNLDAVKKDMTDEIEKMKNHLRELESTHETT